MTTETTPVGAGESSPAPDGSALHPPRHLSIEEVLNIVTWFYQEATRRYLADQDKQRDTQNVALTGAESVPSNGVVGAQGEPQCK